MLSPDIIELNGADSGYTGHWGNLFAKDMLHKRCIPEEDFLV